MRIRQPGKIDDHLWLLGTPESCVYLLEGSDASALITAGLPYVLPLLLEQLARFDLREDKIKYLLILHAHFDHVGIAPFFKRRYPDLQIVASARAWDVLRNPRALEVMESFSIKVAARMGGTEKFGQWENLDWHWRSDVSGVSLKDGDILDLGDQKIEIISTPGHSSCSISAYVPGKNALFPSDAAAIPYGAEFIIAAGSSMPTFEQSLEKLRRKNTRLLCADHYGFVTGEEAATFISKSIEAVAAMKTLLLQTLTRESNVDTAAKKLVARHYALRPNYFVDPEILLVTYTKMLTQYARL